MATKLFVLWLATVVDDEASVDGEGPADEDDVLNVGPLPTY